MKLVLLTVLLLISSPALADYVELSDGRICNKCTVEVKQGFAISLKDKSGDEWLDPSKPMTLTVYGSSFWAPQQQLTTPAGKPPEAPADPSVTTKCVTLGGFLKCKTY